MRFEPTAVHGAVVVELEPRGDERGFFARAWCRREFAEHGIVADMVQMNVSSNARAGTLRGMHLQAPPAAEGKLVRCLRGAIVDVAVDVRPDSPSHGRHVMVELTATNRRALWVPPYVAHGFQTLVDDTDVSYLVSGEYSPAHERGYRFDDPALGIEWPMAPSVLSDKDRSWPLASR